MIFRKIVFLNFAILKSSPNSDTGPPDQKVLSVKLGAFLKTNLWSKFENRNMFTMPNHGLNLLQGTNILDEIFALNDNLAFC